MTCETNHVRSGGLCIECLGGSSMKSAMYPIVVVSAIACLTVFGCMWKTEKDEEQDLAEDLEENEDGTTQDRPKRIKRTKTALDDAQLAHHHDHMSRRAAEISRHIRRGKRARSKATKQKVMRNIMNQYVHLFFSVSNDVIHSLVLFSHDIVLLFLFLLCRSKVIIGWAQIVGSLSVTFSSIPWPKIFIDYTLDFGAIFNLNLGQLFAFSDCQMNLPFLDGYVIHLWFLVSFCMAVVVGYVMAFCCWGRNDVYLAKQYKHICVKILILLITFLYPSICVKTFTGLRCQELSPFAIEDGANVLRVMSEDWNVLCDSGDTYWYNYTMVIYIVLGVVVTGVPLGILTVLSVYRKHLFDSASELHESTVMMFGPLFVQ